MIEIKEIITKLLELMKNKKYRALIILVIYFVFFFIIISMMKSQPKEFEKKETLNALENYRLSSSYDYTLNINREILIKGTKYNDIVIFSTDSDDYYIDKDVVYKKFNQTYQMCDNLNEIEEMVVLLNNINIYNLIKQAYVDYIKEYVDNKKQTEYIIDTTYFMAFFNKQSMNPLNNSHVNISVLEENNQIKSIIFNLGSIENRINYIELNYSNINAIKQIDIKVEG